MQIKYSPDADALIIALRRGRPVNSRDVADRIIVHYDAKKRPLEIEILDASKVVQMEDIDISWKDLLHRQLAA